MAEALEKRTWPYEVYSQSYNETYLKRRHGINISTEVIDVFLEQMLSGGAKAGTVNQYRRCLKKFYADLPADKVVYADTIANWREQMLAEGYAPRTVNVTISAVNRLLDYLGRRDLQTMERAAAKEMTVPELSRAEYLRLLSTAKNLGKEKAYLLTKIFASMALPVQELSQLTVEAVQRGYVKLTNGILPVSDGLQQELLAYARRNNRVSGAIFLTRDGKPLWRTNVNQTIGSLCEDARVPVEKGNPRCLRQLYQATMADIEANVARLVRQEYGRLLESEQAYIGWEN